MESFSEKSPFRVRRHLLHGEEYLRLRYRPVSRTQRNQRVVTLKPRDKELLNYLLVKAEVLPRTLKRKQWVVQWAIGLPFPAPDFLNCLMPRLSSLTYWYLQWAPSLHSTAFLSAAFVLCRPAEVWYLNVNTPWKPMPLASCLLTKLSDSKRELF